jgi:hypothetical protein
MSVSTDETKTLPTVVCISLRDYLSPVTEYKAPIHNAGSDVPYKFIQLHDTEAIPMNTMNIIVKLVFSELLFFKTIPYVAEE